MPAAATSTNAISERRKSYIAGSRTLASPAFSFELDVALDLDRKADAVERQDHFHRQSLVALELAAGDGFAHRLLDLALRGDADLLKKLAHAHVEYVLVHDRLAKVPERWPQAAALYRVGRRQTTGRSAAGAMDNADEIGEIPAVPARVSGNPCWRNSGRQKKRPVTNRRWRRQQCLFRTLPKRLPDSR